MKQKIRYNKIKIKKINKTDSKTKTEITNKQTNKQTNLKLNKTCKYEDTSETIKWVNKVV